MKAKRYNAIEQREVDDLISIQAKLPDNKIINLSVPPDITIADLKVLLEEQTEFPHDRQRLIHFGKMLTDGNTTVTQYGIKDSDFIHVMPLPPNVTSSKRNQSPNPNQNPPLGFIVDLEPEENDSAASLGWEDLELQMWRARVRLISSVMMFYYILQGIGNFSMWLHPEEMDLRFEKGHHPSDFYFTLDLLESLLGVFTAFAGTRAANLQMNSLLHSSMYLRNLIELCVLHFFTFFVYNKEVWEGDVVLNPVGPSSEEVEREAMIFGIFFSLFMNCFLWYTIISCAWKLHERQRRNLGREEEEEQV